MQRNALTCRRSPHRVERYSQYQVCDSSQQVQFAPGAVTPPHIGLLACTDRSQDAPTQFTIASVSRTAERQRLNVVAFTGISLAGAQFAGENISRRSIRRQQPPETQAQGTPERAVTPLQRDPSAQMPQTPSQKPAH